MNSSTGLVITIIVILLIIAIVLCVVEYNKRQKREHDVLVFAGLEKKAHDAGYDSITDYLRAKRANDNNSDNNSDDANNNSDNTEGFAYFNTTTGAHVSPETGAIRGPGIITNGMVRNKPSSDLVKAVNESSTYAEEADFGATYQPNGLDKLMKNQLEIQRINERNDGKVYSQADLQAISSKIQTSASSADNSLFSRAGAQTTDMYLLPTATVGVIDQDFIPERDRNNRVVVAGSAVAVPGFQFDVSRLPVELSKGWMKSNSAESPDYKSNSALKNSLDGIKHASFTSSLGVSSKEINNPELLKNGNSFLISGQ